MRVRLCGVSRRPTPGNAWELLLETKPRMRMHSVNAHFDRQHILGQHSVWDLRRLPIHRKIFRTLPCTRWAIVGTCSVDRLHGGESRHHCCGDGKNRCRATNNIERVSGEVRFITVAEKMAEHLLVMAPPCVQLFAYKCGAHDRDSFSSPSPISTTVASNSQPQ